MFDTRKIRNIGTISHPDDGKSTLVERVLFYTGRIHKIGEVHDGLATMDSMKQERERGITIAAAATYCECADHRINIIDMPGHIEFSGAVERSLRVLDGAVVLFSAVDGVQPQSETVWRQADRYRVPRIAFVNKMDRTGADFHKAIQSMRDRLKAHAFAIQLPVGAEEGFSGHLDLLRMEQTVYLNELGTEFRSEPIPAERMAEALRYRAELLDALSHYNDQILKLLLEEREVPLALAQQALREATIRHGLVPVLCGSAYKNRGVQALLDAVVAYLPSPLDLPPVRGTDLEGEPIEFTPDGEEPACALAFKTVSDRFLGSLTYLRVYSGTLRKGETLINASTGKSERLSRLLVMHADKQEETEQAGPGQIVAVGGLKSTLSGHTLCGAARVINLEEIRSMEPVVAVAVEPADKAGSLRLGEALAQLSMEDPSLQVRIDPESGQTVLRGMGELHLEVALDRLADEFGIKASSGQPQVAYRETITRAVRGVEGRLKRQTGGSGQMAAVVIDLEPHPGEELIFSSAVRGGAISSAWLPAIRKGLEDAMSAGPLGHPLQGLKVSLTGGEEHSVDSSEIAFRVAARTALEQAVLKAGPVLLEPIMLVSLECPGKSMGGLIGELSRRGGRVLSQEPDNTGGQRISGEAPLAELFGYVTSVRSLSQGRASAQMQFQRYSRKSAVVS